METIILKELKNQKHIDFEYLFEKLQKQNVFPKIIPLYKAHGQIYTQKDNDIKIYNKCLDDLKSRKIIKIENINPATFSSICLKITLL